MVSPADSQRLHVMLPRDSQREADREFADRPRRGRAGLPGWERDQEQAALRQTYVECGPDNRQRLLDHRGHLERTPRGRRVCGLQPFVNRVRCLGLLDADARLVAPQQMVVSRDLPLACRLMGA